MNELFGISCIPEFKHPASKLLNWENPPDLDDETLADSVPAEDAPAEHTAPETAPVTDADEAEWVAELTRLRYLKRLANLITRIEWKGVVRKRVVTKELLLVTRQEKERYEHAHTTPPEPEEYQGVYLGKSAPKTEIPHLWFIIWLLVLMLIERQSGKSMSPRKTKYIDDSWGTFEAINESSLVTSMEAQGCSMLSRWGRMV